MELIAGNQRRGLAFVEYNVNHECDVDGPLKRQIDGFDTSRPFVFWETSSRNTAGTAYPAAPDGTRHPG